MVLTWDESMEYEYFEEGVLKQREEVKELRYGEVWLNSDSTQEHTEYIYILYNHSV